MIRVPPLVTRLVAVRERRTLAKMRSTPSPNTRSSCGSAWNPLITRIPAIASVRRPVTSAVMAPRWRKIGRISPNARPVTAPKMASGMKVYRVIGTLMRSNRTSTTTVVRAPPTRCTSPVPTILRTPSASVITRDTRAPVWLLSKNATGRRSRWRCTRARRIEIRCCASTLSRRVSRNELTPCASTAPPTASSSGASRAVLWPPITSSIRYFEAPGSTSPVRRLTTINASPSSSSQRRGQMISDTTRRRLAADTDLMVLFGPSRVVAALRLLMIDPRKGTSIAAPGQRRSAARVARGRRAP